MMEYQGVQDKNLRRKTLEPTSQKRSLTNDENVENSSTSRRKSYSVSKSTLVASNDLSFMNKTKTPQSMKKKKKSGSTPLSSRRETLDSVNSVLFNDNSAETFNGNFSDVLNDSKISGASATNTSDLLSFSILDESNPSFAAADKRRETVAGEIDIMNFLNDSTTTSTADKSDVMEDSLVLKSPKSTTKRRETLDPTDIMELFNEQSSFVSTSTNDKSVHSTRFSSKKSPIASRRRETMSPGALNMLNDSNFSNLLDESSVADVSVVESVSSSRRSSRLSSKSLAYSPAPLSTASGPSPRKSPRFSTTSSGGNSLNVSGTNTSGFSEGSLMFDFQQAQKPRRETIDANDIDGLLDLIEEDELTRDDVEMSRDVSRVSENEVSTDSINTMALCNDASKLLNDSQHSTAVSVTLDTSVSMDVSLSEFEADKSTMSEVSIATGKSSRKSKGSVASSRRSSRASSVKSTTSSKKSKASSSKLTAKSLAMNATVNAQELTLDDPTSSEFDLSASNFGHNNNRDSICTVDLMNDLQNLLPDNDDDTISQMSFDSSIHDFSSHVDDRRLTADFNPLATLLEESMEQSVMESEGNEPKESLEESMMTDNGTVDPRDLNLSSDTLQSFATVDTYALLEDVEDALVKDHTNDALNTSELTYCTVESLGGILDRVVAETTSPSVNKSRDSIASKQSKKSRLPVLVNTPNSLADLQSPPPKNSSGKKHKKPILLVTSAEKAKPIQADFDDVSLSFTATNTVTGGLKSCMSSRKAPKPVSMLPPPSTSKKNVIFGSPKAAEFHKTSPTTNLTPMLRSKAKSMFSMEQTIIPSEPEEEDSLTRENSEELDRWDSLTNASGASESDEEIMVQVQEKVINRRRLSKIQHKIDISADEITNGMDTPSNTSIAFSDCTNTVQLPTDFASLLDQNCVLTSPLIPIANAKFVGVPIDSPQINRGITAGEMFLSRDDSMDGETVDIEADLGTLMRGIDGGYGVNDISTEDSTGYEAFNRPSLNDLSRLHELSDSQLCMDSSYEDGNTLGPLLGLPRESLDGSVQIPNKRRQSTDRRLSTDSFTIEDPVELVNSVIHSRDFSVDEENTMDILKRHQDMSIMSNDETCNLENNMKDLLESVDAQVGPFSGRKRRLSRSQIIDDEVSVRSGGGLKVDESNADLFESEEDLMDEVDNENDVSEADTVSQHEVDLSNATTLIDENSIHASVLFVNEPEVQVSVTDISMDRSRALAAKETLSRIVSLKEGARNNRLSQCATPSLGKRILAQNASAMKSAKKTELSTPSVVISAPVVASEQHSETSIMLQGPFSASRGINDDNVVTLRGHTSIDFSTEMTFDESLDTIALPLNTSQLLETSMSKSQLYDAEERKSTLKSNLLRYYNTVQRIKTALSSRSTEVQGMVFKVLKDNMRASQLQSNLSKQITYEQLEAVWDSDVSVEDFVDSLVTKVAKADVDWTSMYSTATADWDQFWVNMSAMSLLEQTTELSKSTGSSKFLSKVFNTNSNASQSIQDSSHNVIVKAQRTIRQNKKLQAIVNRLTYCRLVTFQSQLIHVEVMLSSHITAVIKFNMAKSIDKNLTINGMFVDLNVLGEHSSNSMASNYFATVMCGANGPISQLEKMSSPSEIPALLQKISSYVAKLRSQMKSV